jgi:DNA polymerase-3 subunit beta
MRFSVQNDVLIKALKDVNNAIASRVVQPILSSVLIESVGDTKLRFTGTDLDLSIECLALGMIESSGSVALPGKRLMEIVSKLSDDLVHFEVDKESFETTIKCGRSKFVLSGLPADDFPKPTHADENAESMVMPSEVLKRSLQQTCFASASYETGSVLSGVYVQVVDGVFETTATDGSRLANRKEAVQINVASTIEGEKQKEPESKKSRTVTIEKPIELKVIVPARACAELLKLIDTKESCDVRVSKLEGMIAFQTDSICMMSRLVGGEYPRYRELLPTEYSYLSTVKRKDLATAVERVSVMADDRTHLVKLHFESDNLQISANTPDVGKAQEELPVKFEGQVLDISINVRYLQDVLQRMDNEEVRLEMNGALKPIIIKGVEEDNYQYLLMPVQSR